MKQQDELGALIKQLLDESAAELTPHERQRLRAARRQALKAHFTPVEAQSWVPAWAGPFSQMTEQRVLGVRYLIPFVALLLGLMGVVYMHTANPASDIADIDAGLLSDELPINAFLDQNLDSWLQRSPR